jgi:hypothetical protein
MSARLSTRIRRAADELEAEGQVTEGTIVARITPTLSAIEREALLRVGLSLAIRDALTKSKRRAS